MPDSVHSRCRMDRERFEPGGRECPLFWCANVSVPCGGRRWPVRFRWRRASSGVAQASHRAGVPVPACTMQGGAEPAVRACGGHVCESKQGPCRNPRPKQLPRSVRTAAGATRAEGPEEGQVKKPTSACYARLTPVGWGRHPANSGPRAVSATHLLACLPEALPARGPPDFEPAHTPAALSHGRGLGCLERTGTVLLRPWPKVASPELPFIRCGCGSSSSTNLTFRHPRPLSRGSMPSPIHEQTIGNVHGMDPRVWARG